MGKDRRLQKCEAVIANIVDWKPKERLALLSMNKEKFGRPFAYSDELIIRISFLRFAFCDKLIPTEALTRRVYGESPDHTTISRRLYRLNMKWNIYGRKKRGRLLAIDASGISVARTGSYRHSKYGGMPRFYKLHALIDVDTKQIADLRVTKDHCSDNRKFLPMVRESVREGDTVYADGAYDSRKNFSFLDDRGIKSGIKIRLNASVIPRGCLPRKKAVMEQFNLLPHSHVGRAHPLNSEGKTFFDELSRMKYWQQKWKEKTGYGRRWLVEAFFSAFKRRFGEHACSRRWKSVCNELKLKAMLYNLLIG
jgi:hypothetical protein